MANIKSYTVKIGNVTNNGVPCPNPIITLEGISNASLNCVDEATNTYEIQVADGDISCFTFLVQCQDCDNCPTTRITKCLCEDVGDCGNCESCVDGVCVNECSVGQVCVDDVCSDCATNEDCPSNQVCNNGSCECPPGTYIGPDGETCIECSEDSDCGVCEVCFGGSCVDKACGDGACNPNNGECVECTSSTHCGTNECCSQDFECECCPGYVKINGLCQPEFECTFDSDCEDCEQCVNGNCVAVQCPAGKVCLNGNCVEECDCSSGGCPEGKYCFDSGTDVCGCLPCQGTCLEGCETPCICNPSLQKCVEDPCVDTSCTSGEDCANGCGCVDGQCVSCSALDCTGSECDTALGCSCRNGNCIDSNLTCANTFCDIASDCGEGCTCVEGQCVSCDNFACSPDECSSFEGCECSGGTCVGSDEDCQDELTITKSDGNCTIIGQLVKNTGCCSCPVMTLASKGKLISSDKNLVFDFLIEVRKGAWDGVSVNSVPRTDNTSNDNIAVNESPISGAMELGYEVTYDIFDIIDGDRYFVSTTTDPRVNTSVAFSASGDSAQVTFSGVELPKIGSETFDADQVFVVKQVKLTFEKLNTLAFPNGCDYAGSKIISTYDINSAADYERFTTSFSNPKASTITSDSCRAPLFKWTKSQDTNFNESPFRKVYIQGGPTYVDQLTDLEGAESCIYYLLDVDCNCTEPEDKFIVLCNPDELDFTVSNCNREFVLNSFDACAANNDTIYRIRAGSLEFTFTPDTAPVGVTKTSNTDILLVQFEIDCDVNNQCTLLYEPDADDLQVDVSTTCINKSDFIAEFTPQVGIPGCDIESIIINGQTYLNTTQIQLPAGSYTAVVNWTCDCSSTTIEFSEPVCAVGCADVEVTLRVEESSPGTNVMFIEPDTSGAVEICYDRISSSWQQTEASYPYAHSSENYDLTGKTFSLRITEIGGQSYCRTFTIPQSTTTQIVQFCDEDCGVCSDDFDCDYECRDSCLTCNSTQTGCDPVPRKAAIISNSGVDALFQCDPNITAPELSFQVSAPTGLTCTCGCDDAELDYEYRVTYPDGSTLVSAYTITCSEVIGPSNPIPGFDVGPNDVGGTVKVERVVTAQRGTCIMTYLGGQPISNLNDPNHAEDTLTLDLINECNCTRCPGGFYCHTDNTCVTDCSSCTTDTMAVDTCTCGEPNATVTAVNDSAGTKPISNNATTDVSANDTISGCFGTKTWTFVNGTAVNVDTITHLGNGVFQYVPTSLGACSFDYEVCCDGVCDQASVSGTGGPRDPFVSANDDTPQPITNALGETIDVTGNDVYTCDAPNSLTWTVVGGSAINATVTSNNNGTFDVVPSGSGSVYFEYEVCCNLTCDQASVATSFCTGSDFICPLNGGTIVSDCSTDCPGFSVDDGNCNCAQQALVSSSSSSAPSGCIGNVQTIGSFQTSCGTQADGSGLRQVTSTYNQAFIGSTVCDIIGQPALGDTILCGVPYNIEADCGACGIYTIEAGTVPNADTCCLGAPSSSSSSSGDPCGSNVDVQGNFVLSCDNQAEFSGFVTVQSVFTSATTVGGTPCTINQPAIGSSQLCGTAYEITADCGACGIYTIQSGTYTAGDGTCCQTSSSSATQAQCYDPSTEICCGTGSTLCDCQDLSNKCCQGVVVQQGETCP